MAFFTLKKWILSWRKEYPDMIDWFSNYVYNTLEQRKLEKQEKEAMVNTLIRKVGIKNMLYDMISSIMMV